MRAFERDHRQDICVCQFCIMQKIAYCQRVKKLIVSNSLKPFGGYRELQVILPNLYPRLPQEAFCDPPPLKNFPNSHSTQTLPTPLHHQTYSKYLPFLPRSPNVLQHLSVRFKNLASTAVLQVIWLKPFGADLGQ